MPALGSKHVLTLNPSLQAAAQHIAALRPR
jgi:hypothetical protein